MSKMSRVTVALLAFLVAAAGCASGKLPPPPEAQPVGGQYRIGAGDVLGIYVWKNPDLSLKDVPVRPDGRISVPLLGDIKAEGLTPDDLKQVISRELDEYVSHADVTVVVLQILSKRAFVIGEVPRPGPVPLSIDMRVLDALSIAGGFGPFANKSDIRIIRKVKGGEVTYHFNYNAYVKGKADGTNIVLQPGDTVVVRE